MFRMEPWLRVATMVGTEISMGRLTKKQVARATQRLSSVELRLVGQIRKIWGCHVSSASHGGQNPLTWPPSGNEETGPTQHRSLSANTPPPCKMIRSLKLPLDPIRVAFSALHGCKASTPSRKRTVRSLGLSAVMNSEAAALELETPSSSSQSSPEPYQASGSPKAVIVSPKGQQELAGQALKNKKSKPQDPSADFVNVLSTRIEEIERAVAAGHGGPAEREAAKARKKQLRERVYIAFRGVWDGLRKVTVLVAKYCSDRTNSAEDRITFIQQKYTQQLSELLRLERQLLDLQREHETVSKEKDKVQSELKKTNLLKDKLEELCRQLQKEAREVAEDSRRRNEEELRQRQALQAKFTQAINEVSEKMDAQASERARQLAENEELKAKLDSFLGQFESFNALVQRKDLELQLANARAEQATALASQLQQRADLLQDANSKYSAAMEAIKPQLVELETLRQRNALLTAAKDELQTQLEHYADKFAEFQDTLTKSNETFASLREQMEAGAKARTVLTRERDEARRRAEANDQTIVALVEDRLQLKQQVEALTGKLRTETEELRRARVQKERLEGLCRALQSELKAAKAAAGGTAAATTAAASADTAATESERCNVGDGNGDGGDSKAGEDSSSSFGGGADASMETGPSTTEEHTGKEEGPGNGAAAGVKAAEEVGRQEEGQGAEVESKDGDEGDNAVAEAVVQVGVVSQAQAAAGYGDALVDGLPNDLY
ncbi:hypothetical protein VOLCADRAFT_106076 [Volvox carteri f. nagariensis]|uniref:Uncharacterized protein n=1 Tax=Volvox carteri f. nagariensis TaxID=3068 RepID=D8U4X6_VOLCA|nr:uncharacterized protein VOLCADRAFT_106076 [Volvox carteri f. nagariensis]EFJ45267.1 hypothetical protein VOLCADRAFT_106076 [Volvox carteri f. nagariensis]|eukprot:XP_002953643.1 hypothetical protein VOLCADRAFT_106076 [Volvox carteri f. nagariensis]